jgi:hypothetical protein
MIALQTIRALSASTARPGAGIPPPAEVLRPEEAIRRDRASARSVDIERDGLNDAPRFVSRHADWEYIATRPWQAPAEITFAAQLFAQEKEQEPSPGPYFEEQPPAIKAYEQAAQVAPTNGNPSRAVALTLWV